MGRETSKLLPKHERLLAGLGENLRLARLRRRLSAEQVAERAGLSRSTLHLMENGSAGTSLGKLVQVLAVLGHLASRRRRHSGAQTGGRPADGNQATGTQKEI
jgi:transcriptional regulator with XRE-family HTH domain